MNVKEIAANMTRQEKAAFLSGKGEWITRNFEQLGIPSLFFSDGPSGVRKQAGAGDHLGIHPSIPATCFPSAATVANSWDEQLAEGLGQALGEEARTLGVHVLLGPGLNIKKNPLCGRNFEYFSEDPYLSGKLAAGLIRGIQKEGVAACPKHFAVNSQELRRMAVNSVLDERTLRELYLTGFEIAVKEGKPNSLMSSYNQVNGVYANENGHLLQDILREEWGFDGFVVTDWGGSNDHVLGVKNGSTLEMPAPGLDSARELLAALDDGRLSECDMDKAVEELLRAVFELTAAENTAECLPDLQKFAHHLLARTVAAESAVLLKNEENTLPLKPKTRVAVIGDFAFQARYQGAGSSMVNSTKVDQIVDLIADYDLEVIGRSRGYLRNGKEDAAMRKEALDLAAKADVVLFFFGLNELSESEGMDRTHLRIPQNQIGLIQELSQVNHSLVGILSAGAVIEMPWHHHFHALLHGYLSGQAGAGAILDILTGAVNPSGKLTETYLKKYEDTPSFRYYPARERNAECREGIYVGYRYFDTAKVPVLYPFGYGLSYTNFAYKDLQITDRGVEFTLANTGKRDGAEITQLYVGLPEAKVFRPQKELKGFAKTFLKAGEERRIRIPFDERTFRFWNSRTNRWETEGGTYQIMIGASELDIRLDGQLSVTGTTENYPYFTNRMPSYYSGKIQKVSDEEFQCLLGHPIPDGSWSGELTVNDALCQMYYAKSGLARWGCRFLTKRLKKAEETGVPDLNTMFQYNMPFRAIAKMTGGMVSMRMVRGLVEVVNGRFFHGMGTVIGGFFENRRLNRQYAEALKRKNGRA